MKCKICVERGVETTVVVGSSMSTLMCELQYYDEDGRYHLHDPNTTTTLYRCSNGHSFGETSRRYCPTCKPKEAVLGDTACQSVEHAMPETTTKGEQR